MNYGYHYGVESEEGLIAVVVYYLICMIFGGGMGIVLYVFRSLGVYDIAKRRGLNHPWLAWIPVADKYLLGCVADQYQYVVKGKNTNRRKWLLGLSIVLAVLITAFVCSLLGMIFNVAGAAMRGANDSRVVNAALKGMLSVMGLSLPMTGVAITVAVFRYIALYDLYTSVDPRNNVMYLVLSILFQVTEPFFIFFNRKKDEGMPPRKAAPAEPAGYVPPQAPPVWEAEQEETEPWKRNDNE